MVGNFFRKKLKNGITVVLEKREVPVVSASVSAKFGAEHEPSEIKGIAHFIEHLLFTGTKTRSHEDISREIEKHGGILNAFTSHEVTSYWFKLPSEHLFSGLDIIVDMLKNPSFDKEKFEKEKKVILEEIKMYHDNPRTAVFEQIEKNLFEAPFGELVIGNEKTVSALERDFVAEYFKKHYEPSEYVVTLVGNADFEKVCAYFEQEFKPLNLKSVPLKIKIKNSESREEREGIDQAHLVFGVHAPKLGDKKVYALALLDSYLAGGMSSKLFLEIREKRGLAYSVKSEADISNNYAYYTIYVGTTKDKLEEVKTLVLDGFKNVEKMSELELKDAKERVIGLKKVGSEESTEVMRGLLSEELGGDAGSYYRFEKEIEKVKLKDVKLLAKALIEQGYSSAIIAPK